MDRPIRTRIAPSPTGDPHVGTGYIALFNYAFAKQHGGQFLLRIEDTDQARSTKESEVAIFDALRWLGLSWDEGPDVGGDKGPYRQSERTSIYREHAQMLIDKGAAYKCTCTSERLTAVRQKQEEEKSAFRGYDGHCRDKDAAAVEAEIKGGAAFVVRLKTPADGDTVFHDALRGEISIANKDTDDQVLLKSDGFPTYHLANVVDDHLMGITHVIRGEEWIKSTPKHVMLYDAFGWNKPSFAHLPLLRNRDKSKVSKRKNPVSISYYRESGYLPDAFVNFLGHMAFTFEDERDVFSLEDFVSAFKLEKVSLGAPIFDLDKLLWLNGVYLREHRTEEQVVEYLKTQLFSDAYLRKIVPLVQKRVEKAEDFVPYADFFFAGEVGPVDPAVYVIRDWAKKKTVKFYEAMVEKLDTQYDWNEESIGALLKDFVKENELKPKDVFMPLRMMVTGKKSSPDLFSTMAVLGRERCRTRIRKAIADFKQFNPPQ